MARLGRRVPAEAADEEEQHGGEDDTGGEQAGLRPFAREPDQPDQGEHEHDDECARVAGRRVAGDVPEVGEHLPRGAKLPAAAAPDADVEAVREHEAAPPERDREEEDGRKGRDRLPKAAPRHQDVQPLRAEHQRAVGMRGDREQHQDRPGNPGAAAAVERAEQRQVRERGEEEEEAVHPRVDAVEEQHPASGRERGRGEPRPTAGEPAAEDRDRREARRREERGEEAHRLEPTPGVGDDPGEHEVERRAAALPEHDVEQVAERVAADEQRQRLVLVRRPAGELDEQEGARTDRDRRDARGEQAPAEVSRRRPGERTGPGFDGCLGHGCSGYAAGVAADAGDTVVLPCRSTNFVVRKVICSRFSTR